MSPGHWAREKPATPAIINAADGSNLTWQQLDERSNQVAQLLAARGLGQSDHVCLMAENQLDFFVGARKLKSAVSGSAGF